MALMPFGSKGTKILVFAASSSPVGETCIPHVFKWLCEWCKKRFSFGWCCIINSAQEISFVEELQLVILFLHGMFILHALIYRPSTLLMHFFFYLFIFLCSLWDPEIFCLENIITSSRDHINKSFFMELMILASWEMWKNRKGDILNSIKARRRLSGKTWLSNDPKERNMSSTILALRISLKTFLVNLLAPFSVHILS
jgi:hypothetical protein